jgi:hypothetical protein
VTGAADAETEIEHLRTGARCRMPTQTLRMIKAAGLTALAARELVVPGVVTAAAFGGNAVLPPQVATLARYLPMLGHIAVFVAVEPLALIAPLGELERGVLDQLDQAGIGLSTADDPRAAAFGANLLMFADPALRAPDVGALSSGVLVVNASGHDLPAAAMDSVDRLIVDDLRLLDANGHRDFVRQHFAATSVAAEATAAPREGWHRLSATWRTQRWVDADLVGVLAGVAPGRRYDEDVLLVELLDVAEVDVTLAGRLQRSAVQHGLGRWTEPG